MVHIQVRELLVGEHIHTLGGWPTRNSTGTDIPALGTLLDITLCTFSSDFTCILYNTFKINSK